MKKTEYVEKTDGVYILKLLQIEFKAKIPRTAGF